MSVKRGQIGQNTDVSLCRLEIGDLYEPYWYPSIKALLRTTSFKERVLGCLPADNPAILHVDFGCGPGTVSRAIMDMLIKDARPGIKLTTIGHDHNSHMPDIAREDGQEELSAATYFEFHHDWNAFQQDIQSHIKQKWHAVWITANYLFGQDTFEDADAEKIVETINSIVEGVSQATRIHLFGVHPNHRDPKERWRSIAQRTKAEIIIVKGWININPTKEVSPWNKAKWACICEVQR